MQDLRPQTTFGMTEAQFLKKYDRMINAICVKYLRHNTMTMEDLLQTAKMAAIMAFRRFDSEKGNIELNSYGQPKGLNTWVCIQLKGALQTAMRKYHHSMSIPYDKMNTIQYTFAPIENVGDFSDHEAFAVNPIDPIESRIDLETCRELLTEEQFDCLMFKYGVSATIKESLIPVHNYIADVALIKLKNKFGKNFSL